MASKYAGYMGKVIMVDLTTQTVREYPWSDEQRELYLGGKIMAARILCDHLTGKETAFSEVSDPSEALEFGLTLAHPTNSVKTIAINPSLCTLLII